MQQLAHRHKKSPKRCKKNLMSSEKKIKYGVVTSKERGRAHVSHDTYALPMFTQ